MIVGESRIVNGARRIMAVTGVTAREASRVADELSERLERLADARTHSRDQEIEVRRYLSVSYVILPLSGAVRVTVLHRICASRICPL